MNKHEYTLSVCIPARNEEFLAITIKNILENKNDTTEVIVNLDGYWPTDPIEDHPDLTLIHSPEPIGQREGVNQCVRLSKAKYIMKIDAHSKVDKDFDKKLLADMQDDYTMVPTLYNLHMFDWVCPDGHRRYQSPSGPCKECGKPTKKDIIFKERLNRKSTHYRFDTQPHFQYWNARRKLSNENEPSETFSLQGSCFLMTREKYWELNIGDTDHGSWGSQGIQVALSTWLSGGKVITNPHTWYSHMFRTQGGDFGFPYEISGNEQNKAKEYAREMWFNNRHPKQIYPLSWLLERFAPIPDWHDEKGKETLELVNKKGEEFYAQKGIQSHKIASSISFDHIKGNIIFYTDCQLKLKYAHIVQRQLRSISNLFNIPIVSASLKPMDKMGKNIHIPLQRGLEAYFTQIISALEASDADIVYMAEHDVIYHPSHFEFIPPRRDKFYYNQNFWRIRPEQDNFAVHWNANQVSGLVCYRELLLDWYKKKWEQIQTQGFDRSYEPGGRDTSQYEVFFSKYPNVDLRVGNTLTKSKWSLKDFRDKSTAQGWEESTLEKIPGWNLKEAFGL